MVDDRPVKNTTKNQVYRATQILWYWLEGGYAEKLFDYEMEGLMLKNGVYYKYRTKNKEKPLTDNIHKREINGDTK